MRFSARILGVVLVVLFLFLPIACSLLPSAAYAQEQNPYSSLIKTDPSVPMSISVLTQGVFLGLLSSATCIVGGIDFTSPTHKCLDYNVTTGTFGYATQSDGGLLGLGATGIAMTFNSPLHTSDYIHYLSSNFGLVKKAQAAGDIGFDQLSPITGLWLAFRNLAYLLFVVVFVVIGFAIMLRAKIDPRTVMTIENQIPKLIVALLLITFSFAIAGMMIDIMWVGIYLIINIFGSLDPALARQVGVLTGSAQDNPFNFVSNMNSGPAGFIGIAQQAAGAIKDITSVIVYNIFQTNVVGGILKAVLIPLFGLPLFFSCLPSIFGLLSPIPGGTIPIIGGGVQNFGQCLDAGIGNLVGYVIAGLTFLIFAVAMFVAIAKLWWSLVKAYVLFLIFTIFAPLIIMSGVIPGWTKTNFEWWLRHIAAYAIVFPTAMGVFLLGKTLMDLYATQIHTAPPLLGINGNALQYIGPLLGFAVIMLAPQSLAMVQDALNAPDPKYLASIGASIGVGSQFLGGGVGKLWDRSFRESDPLRGLDEGWMRKFLLPRNSFQRRIFIGKETGTGLKPDKTD